MPRQHPATARATLTLNADHPAPLITQFALHRPAASAPASRCIAGAGDRVEGVKGSWHRGRRHAQSGQNTTFDAVPCNGVTW